MLIHYPGLYGLEILLILLTILAAIRIVPRELRTLRTNEFLPQPRLLPQRPHLFIFTLTQVLAIVLTFLAGVIAWHHYPIEENNLGIETYPTLYYYAWGLLWALPQLYFAGWLSRYFARGRRSLFNDLAVAPGGIYAVLQPLLWSKIKLLVAYSLPMIIALITAPGYAINWMHLPAIFANAVLNAVSSVLLIVLLSLKFGTLLTVVAFAVISGLVTTCIDQAATLYAQHVTGVEQSRTMPEYYHQLWLWVLATHVFTGLFSLLFSIATYAYLRRLKSLPTGTRGA